jgi:ParB-like chromosome segregation protein Spo0J
MNITWTTEKRKVSDLAKAEYNPRKLTEKEREDLERSIDEYGVVVPVVVNVGDREDVLIGGHQRIRIYQDRGFDEVEVRVPSRELTEPEETR